LEDRVRGLDDVGEDGQALGDLLQLLGGGGGAARGRGGAGGGAERARAPASSPGFRAPAAARHLRSQSATSTLRRCSFSPPLMPTAFTTTTWRPSFASWMNSLKDPSPCTSTRCPFTVRVAPGSVRPLIWRMLARTSSVSMVSGGGGPS